MRPLCALLQCPNAQAWLQRPIRRPPSPPATVFCHQVLLKEDAFPAQAQLAVKATLQAEAFEGVVEDTGHGGNSVRLCLTKPGTYALELSVDQSLLTKKPLPLVVEPGPVCAETCKLEFLGGKARSFGIAAVAGRDGFFLVHIRDAHGNTTTLAKGDELLQAVCRDPAVKILRQEPHSVGVYKVTYYTEKAGDFEMEVMIASKRTKVVVRLKELLTVTVQPNYPCRLHCKLKPPLAYRVGDEVRVLPSVHWA